MIVTHFLGPPGVSPSPILLSNEYELAYTPLARGGAGVPGLVYALKL